MIRGLYSAASGMDAAIQNQDVTAENLAHANVPGYRRRGVSFETFETALQNAGLFDERLLTGVQPSVVYDNFDPGPAQFTGNPFDLLPTGNTFFTLDGPNGPLLTRNGAFELNERKELQSKNGLRVLGEGGTITVPDDATRVDFARDGGVLADGVEIGRLQLTAIPSPIGLRRVGTTFFEGGTSRQGVPEPGTVGVEAGFIEGSNVQVVKEMVSMIAGLRHFEAAQRAFRAISEAISLNTRPQA